MTGLEDWGWDDGWSSALVKLGRPVGAECARVTGQDRDRWTVQLQAGSSVARVPSGSFAGPHPVTGDWVVTQPGPMPADPVSIVDVLPRRSALSRGKAGTGATEQVLAANVDVVWIVHGLDTPPNPRRMERYLAIAWESGAVPEIVLTKADLATDPASVVDELGFVVMGVQVHVTSTEQPESIRELRASLKAGRTVALVGPSGAGKSTLINALAEMPLTATGSVRESDRKGRHITTRRELFQIPGGALLLDTPGLRELRTWELTEGLDQAFPEIEGLAAACRFRDCRHDGEPGCAVLAAVEAGELDPDRLAGFRKLRAEADYMLRRVDPRARALAVARHKTALKTLKYHPKYGGTEERDDRG
jgi:ribosome biogenesis GTPase / thiamine phosphate phosphatase